MVCYLPIKSPWLTPIEPKWVQVKQRVMEPDRVLTGMELAQRVCKSFDCACRAHLSIAE